MNRRALYPLLGILVGVASGCGNTAPSNESVVETRQALEPARTYSITVPVNFTPQGVVFGATDRISVNDRAVLRDALGAGATLTNTGTGQVNIGVDARVGRIMSRGSVFLRERARVQGNVETAGTITTQNGVVITGLRRSGINFGTPTTTTWTIEAPTQCIADVNLEPDRSLELKPGAYGNVSVKSRSTLTISSGSYVITSLTLEPQARLLLDQSEGPVHVWTTSGVTFRGTIATTSGPPNLVIGHVGTSDVVIEAPFQGTVVAPNARIALATVGHPGHTGAFFGKVIEVFPDTTVTLSPFRKLQTLPETTPPPPMPPNLMPPPAATPVLSANLTSVQNFIAWTSKSRVTQVTQAQQAVAQVQGNNAVAGLLITEAETSVQNDIGRALVVFSILGELRASMGEQYFIDILARPAPTTGTLLDHDTTLREAQALEMLQAKAIDGLAFMNSSNADGAVLNAVANHPSPTVRAQAVRAYLENKGPSGRAQVQAVVRAGEEVLLDRVEHHTLWDKRSFDERMETFIQNNPDFTIPPPEAFEPADCVE